MKMEIYISPALKVVNMEPRSSYLQIVSDNTGYEGGGKAEDISIIFE